ncbi:MAG: transposase, partial [Nitrospiria bacterium]
PTLGEIIRTFKAVSARQIRENNQLVFPWQRNYYEHIIRNDHELNRIRQYIRDNPLNWETDKENPNGIPQL